MFQNIIWRMWIENYESLKNIDDDLTNAKTEGKEKE